MRKKRGIWIFVFLLIFPSLVSSVFAQEVYEIEVSVNAVNIDGFNSVFSIYDFNAQNSTSGNQVVEAGNILRFSLHQGYYEIAVGINNPVTPGFDYYGKISLTSDADKRVELDAVPVGSRKIEIVDKNDAPLHDIPVRIDCNSLSGEQEYFRTDDFGIAEANFLPIGNCTFRAAAGEFIITQEDVIDKGSAENIVLKFDKYSKNNSGTAWIIVISVIVVLGLLAYFYLAKNNGRKKHRDVEKNDVEEKKSDNDEKKIENVDSVKNDSVKKDIMTALNASERKVVNFILEEQEKYVAKDGSAKGFYLHQAKIVYGAGIPKTTLVRLLQSLEQKKIIEWERSGKIKKVKLTEWFNSK